MSEREKIETVKDREENQRLLELYQWEQRMKEERQAKLKRDLMHDQMVRPQLTSHYNEKQSQNDDLVYQNNEKKSLNNDFVIS